MDVMSLRHLLLLATAIAALPAGAQMPPPASWIADDKTGCRVRNPAPQPRETVTWSGACPNGIAGGTGVLQWFDDRRPTDCYEGEFSDGWENGRGIATSTAIADRYEGEWLGSKPNGQGVYTDAADAVSRERGLLAASAMAAGGSPSAQRQKTAASSNRYPL